MKLFEKLRADRKTKMSAIDAIIEKAVDEAGEPRDLTVEEQAQIKALTDGVKAIDGQLDSLDGVRSLKAKDAVPASTPVDRPAARAPAAVRSQADGAPFAVGALLAAAAAVKGGLFGSIGEALEESSMARIADDFLAAGGRKQLLSSAGTGAILVPPSMATEIIEFLRPSTTFIQAGPRRVPLINGSYYQAGGNTGASAAYGRENSVPTFSEATFRDLNLSSKELQGKTAVSNLLLQRGVAGVQSFVEEDLRTVMAETMDLNMFLGDGLQNRPLGIYNLPGVGTRGAQASTTPTVAQIEADLRWAINYLGTRNVPMSGWKWTMSLQTAGYLEDLRDGNGNFIYPTMQGQNKTLKGFPVLITTNLPTNLGGGSNESHISLVAWPHVYFGEEDSLQFRVTDEGAYTDGGGNVRSTIERNETAMFVFMRHDVGARHLAAIAILTGVTWGR